MLTLYVKTACPYCKRVLETLHDMDVSYNVRNVADEENLQQLMQHGGQHQTPFLYNEDGTVNLYETDKIIAYLHERFG